MSVDYDPLVPDYRDDPYPTYRELRDHEPVHWAPEIGAFCLSRFEDVSFVLKNPEIFSSRAMFTVIMNGGREGGGPLNWQAIRFLTRFALRTRYNPIGFLNARNLIAEDGESHSAMRSIVNRGFTPKQIASWEPRIRAQVESCTAKLRGGEAFDVMKDLAIPLPVAIISEMLGIEAERRSDFKRWSDSIIHNATGAGRSDPLNPQAVETILELLGYLARIARERRRKPADDLVSLIVAQQDGEIGLKDRDVSQFVVVLLVAGNETTTNLIGNATSALLAHPAQLERLIADPALIPSALEETVRYDPPIQILFRKTTRDVEIRGTRIPEGAIVAPLIGSANRDERRFPDPDRFDIGRNTQGHVGFGFGKHFCLGASLARLEARLALEALTPELPRFVHDEPRKLVDSFLVRGLRELPLRPATRPHAARSSEPGEHAGTDSSQPAVSL